MSIYWFRIKPTKFCDSLRGRNRHVSEIFLLCVSKDKADDTLDSVCILVRPWGTEQVMQDVFQVANYTLRKIEIYWLEESSTAERVRLKVSAKQLGFTTVPSLFQFREPPGTCHKDHIIHHDRPKTSILPFESTRNRFIIAHTRTIWESQQRWKNPVYDRLDDLNKSQGPLLRKASKDWPIAVGEWKAKMTLN